MPSASRAALRTEPAAQWPPTNPSMDPSARMIARSPGRAEVGSCARTTVACTNGTPLLVSSSTRVDIVVVKVTDVPSDRRRGSALHGVPHP